MEGLGGSEGYLEVIFPCLMSLGLHHFVEVAVLFRQCFVQDLRILR